MLLLRFRKEDEERSVVPTALLGFLNKYLPRRSANSIAKTRSPSLPTFSFLPLPHLRCCSVEYMLLSLLQYNQDLSDIDDMPCYWKYCSFVPAGWKQSQHCGDLYLNDRGRGKERCSISLFSTTTAMLFIFDQL